MASDNAKNMLNRLDERLDRFDDKVTGKLDTLIIQTTKTNGRVTNLERLYDELYRRSGVVERRVSSLEETDRITSVISENKSSLKKEFKADKRWWFEQFKFFAPYIVTTIIAVYLILKETGLLG